MTEVLLYQPTELRNLVSNFVTPFDFSNALVIAARNLRVHQMNILPVDPKFETPGFLITKVGPTPDEYWESIVSTLASSFPASEISGDGSYLLTYPNYPSLLVYPSSLKRAYTVAEADFLTGAVIAERSIWEHLQVLQARGEGSIFLTRTPL